MPDKPKSKFALQAAAYAKKFPYHSGVRSWPFEPYLELHKDTANDALALVLHELCESWMQGFKRKPNEKRQTNFISCLRLILLNLMRVQTFDAYLTVGIPSGKGRLHKERRYLPDFMSVHYHRNALKLLQDRGLVWIVKAGHQQEDYAETARYSLTDAARDNLPLPDLKLHHFETATRDEVVLLKDTKRRLTNYTDTDATRKMRLNLRRLNKILDRTDIAATRPLSPITDFDESYRGERTSLYRVFNNGSFEQGGRFYGGWWEHAKKVIRPKIILDRQPTVEVDFKGLHPAMLFAKKGYAIPEDPYALIPGITGNDALRSHAKVTFLALLNAGKRGTKEPTEFDPTVHGMTKKAFQQVVKDAFPMLPGIFGTGIGLRLQREDSDLAEKIMLHFMEQGIPVLPVHDSFIIAAQHQSELIQVMKSVFHDTYGQTPEVTITKA